MTSLSDLKAKRAAMTEGEWDKTNDISIVDVRALDSSGKLRKIIAVCNIHHNDDATDEEHANATGIAATHNAADALIAVCEAALAWRDQRADNLLAALALTDAEIEAEAQDVSRARVKRTAELASALERALAKIKP